MAAAVERSSSSWPGVGHQVDSKLEVSQPGTTPYLGLVLGLFGAA